jgi:hydrogenase nickel incorporation protein HypA/HybF
MHELSLAQEIVRMVQATAQREQFQRVATLRLEAGVLAGVEVGALRFALDAMVGGTCLEGACIEIDEPPGAAWCARCQRDVVILTRADPCPVCHGYPLKPVGGMALRVLDLVVVDD